MKKGLLILVMSVIAIGLNAQSKETAEATFKVPMHCQSCVNKVEKNIAFEKGVKNITCNLEKQTVTVSYKAGKTNVEQLKQGFAKIGYKDVAVVDGEKCCAKSKASCTKEKTKCGNK